MTVSQIFRKQMQNKNGCKTTLKLLIKLQQMSTQIAKSVQVKLKVPNFQKDVIYPAIYDLDNMKLIQSCAYPESPKNKVIELKKKNIQKVILSIINKPNVSTHSITHSIYFKSNEKSDLKVESKLYRDLVEQKLVQHPFEIQIDEQLGELAINMEEDFIPFKEKVKRVLQKANHHQKIDEKQQQRRKQVQNFVKVICGPSQLSTPNPDKFKKTSGLLEQLDQMSKRKPQSAMRKRAQSAKVLKNNPSSQSRILHTRRLSQSRMTVSRNLNCNKMDNRKSELNKSQKLFEKINAYYEGQDRDKKRQKASLTKMRGQWDEQGPLQRLVRLKIQELNPRTLQILRQRRLKQSALTLMDSQYLQL